MGQQRPSVSLCRHCNPYIELGAYTRFLIAVELKNAFKVVGKGQKTAQAFVCVYNIFISQWVGNGLLLYESVVNIHI